jgi:magnesium-transporting ATPase (P-type)
MLKFDLKNIPSTASRMDLMSGTVSGRQPLSAPATTKLNRRVSNVGAFLRSRSNIGDSTGLPHSMRQNSVAWQTMSQHLNLQLQQLRRSQLAIRRRCPRPRSAPEEQKDHITMLIDERPDSKVRPTTIQDQYDYHSGLELEELSVEDKSLLKTDVHIIPLEKLAERFNCNLTHGLTDEIVTEHRNTFGQNKLTPPPKPSLLWMFIKQILVGFNGILWIATLFAFLSYVRLFDGLF